MRATVSVEMMEMLLCEEGFSACGKQLLEWKLSVCEGVFSRVMRISVDRVETSGASPSGLG